MTGSPYLVFNDITVSSGQSLVIDPGVAVIFQGPYSIVVYGTFRAAGTSSSPITFDVQDTTGLHIHCYTCHTGGWNGIKYMGFSGSFTDSSILSYCNFQHLKNSTITPMRGLRITHCTFTNNTGSALNLIGGTGLCEVDHCSFHDNIARNNSIVTVNSGPNIWHFHHNDLHSNYMDSIGRLVYVINSSFLFSGNDVHHNTNIGNDSVAPSYILYLISTSTADESVISNNRIYENMCHKAAPIYCYNTMADIYKNYICNNYHISGFCGFTDGGGAICLINSGSTLLGANYTVRSNVIANNYSPAYGGGIRIFGASTLIANNTIINNKAALFGPGISVNSTDTISLCIRNNIITGNKSEAWGHVGNIQIGVGNECNLKYDHNWTDYPFDSNFNIYTSWGGLLNIMNDTSTNIIGTNPGLTAPTTTANLTDLAIYADFSLTHSSPCLNAGLDSATTPGSSDCAGNNRINGAAVDIGAYEYGASVAGTAPILTIDSVYRSCCNLYRHNTPPNPVLTVHTQEKTSMNIYPNPASGILFVSLPKTTGRVLLQNMIGETIAEMGVINNITSFDVHTLPRGIYHAVWNDGAGTIVSKKIIVE